MFFNPSLFLQDTEDILLLHSTNDADSVREYETSYNRKYKYFLVSIPTIASESKRIEEGTKEGRGEAFSSRAIS